jgi:hypothetical protein
MNVTNAMGVYNKLIVYVLTATAAYLQVPHLTWRAGVLGAIGAFLLWLVPNTPKVPPVVPPAA